MRICRICLFIIFHTGVYGQVVEDFSDGEFYGSPPWYGQTESFRVNNDKQLQLDESGTGSAYLSTVSHINSQATWQFDIEMSFNPSASNFCSVYLISDSHNLSAPLNGYYVKIGGTQDEISLYRQDLSNHLKIIDGADGITDTLLVKMGIKVTRDANGKWEVFQKADQDSQYQIVGESVDATHHRANFFGIFCQFTTTRSKAFFLDNIHIQGLSFTDNHPPALHSLKTLDNRRIELLFNEPLQVPELYQFNVTGQGSPVRLIHTGYNTWQIEFPFSFKNGFEYTLELNGIQDLFGNELHHSRQFQFWEVGKAAVHDVVISEIMVDPSPSLQLPEQEYIEILNVGDSAINLLNWTLSDATSKVLLPDHVLNPGDYLVLLPDPASFPYEESLLLLDSWPALNNTGDLITLTDTLGKIIHFVNYSDSWYKNSLKQHGGWSLEMIDVRYPCSGGPNWTASIAPSGGTPGKINSVTTDNPDLTPPQIVNTFAETPFHLTVLFDQPLSANAVSSSQITIEPYLQVDTFFVGSPVQPSLTIRLKDSLQAQVLYKMTANGFADCNQNINYNQGPASLVGLPQKADSGDLVISEILFNPKPLGIRFVELFNRSGKAINLRNWRFARWQAEALSDFALLTEENQMIYPGEYRVFTESESMLKSQYPLAVSVLEVDHMTSMDEKRGNLVLLAPGGYIVDEVHYREDMHHSLLIDRNGVSLERADPDAASADPNNWFSGSEYTGYATPGFQNSQYFVPAGQQTLSVEPTLISPVSSRLPSYARISFSLEGAGNSGSILIFNRQGYLVRTLLNNSILPVDGTYQWDGTNDKAQRVPMGYYIIQLRVISSHHSTEKWQKTIAVVPDF